MPKEHMQSQVKYEPSPDGDGFRSHTCGLEVAWMKDGRSVTITPAWYQADYPDAPKEHPDARLLPEAQTSDEAAARTAYGWHTFAELARTMDWGQLNDLIKVLRRARDDSFGKPE